MRNTMADDPPTEEMRPYRRLVLPALAISDFAMVLPAVLTSLLLIDIGLTFGYSVGVMGQILAIASSVGIVTTLVVGALSVRFKHSWLLMVGLAFFCVSALACGFASSAITWFVGSSLGVLGSSMVTPMLLTAIGDYFPQEKRPGAIGWINTSGALAYSIGQPAIGLIASLSGWRLGYLGLILPIALLGLFLSLVGLPAESHMTHPTASRVGYLEGFSQIVRNRSAFACLIGVVFWNAGFVSILTYSTSFYREQFMMSMPLMSILNIGRMLCYIFASLVCGRLLNRYERRSITVSTGVLGGLSTIVFFLMPDLWISLIVSCLSYLFTGLVSVAMASLILEQIPRLRGTMMSLYTTAGTIGTALGGLFGGLLLVSFNYEIMGAFLGFMYIMSATVYHFLVIDPERSAVTS